MFLIWHMDFVFRHTEKLYSHFPPRMTCVSCECFTGVGVLDVAGSQVESAQASS